jgi:hypothetical protein
LDGYLKIRPFQADVEAQSALFLAAIRSNANAATQPKRNGHSFTARRDFLAKSVQRDDAAVPLTAAFGHGRLLAHLALCLEGVRFIRWVQRRALDVQ